MKLALLGAGAWGTALAISLARAHEVILWTRDAALAETLLHFHLERVVGGIAKIATALGDTRVLWERQQQLTARHSGL